MTITSAKYIDSQCTYLTMLHHQRHIMIKQCWRYVANWHQNLDNEAFRRIQIQRTTIMYIQVKKKTHHINLCGAKEGQTRLQRSCHSWLSRFRRRHSDHETLLYTIRLIQINQLKCILRPFSSKNSALSLKLKDLNYNFFVIRSLTGYVVIIYKYQIIY